MASITSDPTPQPDKRVSEPQPLPSLHLVELPVSAPDNTFVTGYRYVERYARERGFVAPVPVTGCEYVEFSAGNAPSFIPISGCIFAMVVGEKDPMAFAHIPSGMHDELPLQRDTIRKLVEKLQAEEGSTLILAGLGERRGLSGLNASDPQRAAAVLENLQSGELGKRWDVFNIFTTEMRRLNVPLSRLTLSVKGPSEPSDFYADNAVAVVPAQRGCVVFYKSK